MTLKCYYNNLPWRITPRKEFIDRISQECGVSTQTVRNWCLYGIKPMSYEHVKVLMRVTGLKEDELWES